MVCWRPHPLARDNILEQDSVIKFKFDGGIRKELGLVKLRRYPIIVLALRALHVLGVNRIPV